MKTAQQTRIEEIMDQMTCPKGFHCYRSDFEELCNATYDPEDGFVECLQPAAEECWFAVNIGQRISCHCPLRVYIAKNLKK